MYLAEMNSDNAVLAELGRRLARVRLERGLSRAGIAGEAGVGTTVVARAERGESVQMTSMVRLLRALGLLAGLDVAVPEGAVATPVPARRRAWDSSDLFL